MDPYTDPLPLSMWLKSCGFTLLDFPGMQDQLMDTETAYYVLKQLKIIEAINELETDS